MNKKVERNYLEISYLEDLKDSSNLSDHYSINLVDPVDFQLNKFFYKNIGKSHHWVDRLVWSEKQWQDYVSDKKVKTYVLKEKNELAGYFELISHTDKNEVEIAYLGLLEEYQIKKNKSFIGSSVEVLVENKLKNQNKYFGRNIYLNSVIFECEQKYIGKVINVKVTKVNRNTLFGKIDHNKNMRAA